MALRSRSAACIVGAAILAVVAAAGAIAGVMAGSIRHHALSLVGAPQYGADFEHFAWVRPDAPKGGTVRIAVLGTFDSLNQFPIKGNAANGLGLLYDALMAGSIDESSTEYGLIAEWVSYAEDFSSVTFGLRAEARFHDGAPVTPEDVIFSLETLKKVSPSTAFYYKNVVSVEKTGPRQVTFRFNVKGNRELPQIVGQLPILPRHYWTGTGKDGKPRDLSRTTLSPPLGSGPYRIGRIEAGRFLVYERVANYWAKDLPVSRGQWNFDRIRFEYFRDATIAFQAFKAGKIDFYQETSSKNWATGYGFPAVRKGWVRRKEVPLKTVAPMQGFVLNLRRPKFRDRRMRRAFNLAFDFEWANKNLFYGQYKRVSSYFENTELAARDLPEGREKAILEEVRDLVPPEVFTKPYTNPVGGNSRAVRRNLRQAARLLKDAGWVIRSGRLINSQTGKPMQVEFLIVSPLFERIVLAYIRNLSRLGIKASVRLVDSSQYRRRLDTFDFDIVVGNFAQSHSPGNEQRDFWGSAAAKRQGSRNLIGIVDPAVDKLIDRIIFAKSRPELVAATRALDRVLLWNYYIVPQWYAPKARIAYWAKFAHPKRLPSLRVGFLQVWWYDAKAARKLAADRGQ